MVATAITANQRNTGVPAYLCYLGAMATRWRTSVGQYGGVGRIARHERFLACFGELRRIHSFIDCRAELTVSRRAQDVTRNRFSLEFRNYLQKYALSGVEVLVSSGFGL